MNQIASSERGRRRRLRLPPLGIQVLIALILGAVFGLVGGATAESTQVLGDAFIRLIQMVVIPLIFPLVVVGIAQMESARRLGRIAGKTILYFEVVTTIVLVMATALAVVTRVGVGAHLAGGNSGALGTFAQGIDFKTFLLDIIPSNFFSALGSGNLLAVVFFAVFFGLAMAHIGERAAPVRKLLESVSDIMFTVVGYVVRFAPIGVFGYIAYDTARYGFHSLVVLSQFIGVVYLGLLIVMFVLFPIVAKVFHVSFVGLLRAIWDLVLVAFATRSSESVLAPLLERVERYGVSNSVVSFVLPLGYSFNLAGATLYEATAVVFLSHAYGLSLSIVQLLTIIGILALLTKGLAGVPSAAIVVLLATAKAVGLPPEGVALLLGIDFIVDMARTAVDTFGTPLAAVVIAKSEGLFRPQPGIDVRQPATVSDLESRTATART